MSRDLFSLAGKTALVTGGSRGIGLMIARLLAQLGLEALNRAEVRRHAGSVPGALTGVMDEATFAKAANYTLAKSRFGSWEMIYEAVVLVAVIFSGLLPWLWAKFDGSAPGAAWSGALFLVVTMILIGLPGLPLAWWSQFRLEARYGFNQSTLLARGLAPAWGVPVWDDVLQRTRATAAQARWTPADRLRHVAGAFGAVASARPRLRGAHVVLVDDVVTPASTLNAGAAALGAGGALIVS